VIVGLDTNALLRFFLRDNPQQAACVDSEIMAATAVAIPTTALCEMVWVLKSGYHRTRDDIRAIVAGIVCKADVIVDEVAVNAGLAVLDAGGDFADGVIAAESRRLGGDEFLTFDRRAARAFRTVGIPARVLA